MCRNLPRLHGAVTCLSRPVVALLVIFSVLSCDRELVEIEFVDESGGIKAVQYSDIVNSPLRREVRIRDPFEQSEINYRAVPLVSVLEQVWGDWRRGGALTIECLDGYKVAIPTYLIDRHSPLLAFGIKDRSKFGLVNYLEGGTYVDLAPLFLIWDTPEMQERREGVLTKWPYQAYRFKLNS